MNAYAFPGGGRRAFIKFRLQPADTVMRGNFVSIAPTFGTSGLIKWLKVQAAAAAAARAGTERGKPQTSSN
ncbi:hypothetical protein JYU34_007851 [Plutella xylostella]|uniref:Uncharacterized protein n=1 Tax=Plutella xylostella TaxID=51655 RepID=A0ABQ7QRE2_PLUXY|nr:hypothetical protein JYU34_007851 [Plutella xylostella]